MDTVVLVLMLLTAFNFLLKQTFWKLIAVGIITAICAVFAGLMWPYAIEQSKTQIANWLSNQPLMLDTSVLLSVEVCIQMAYAMLAVHVANDYPVKPRMILMYRFLRWFPGLLIFPVLFSGLVYLIFAFPGTSFQTIAWSYAAFILAAIPMVILMILVESVAYIPALTWMDSYQPEHLLMQLPILAVGMICYAVFLSMAYHMSVRNFAKADLF